ncbi:hypothetical protein MN608_11705 [Microdochium nivale]|nr:hypothetical protein MN608_11705 [Microdochium nivale]
MLTRTLRDLALVVFEDGHIGICADAVEFGDVVFVAETFRDCVMLRPVALAGSTAPGKAVVDQDRTIHSSQSQANIFRYINCPYIESLSLDFVRDEA